MRQETRLWLARADHDMGAAASLVRDGFWPGAAFFCQQAIEKMLKALVVQCGKTPPRIHDLEERADIADLPLRDDQRLYLTRLTDHSTRARYFDAEYDKEGVRQLHTETEAFFQWLRDQLS